jgi:hypothetical protein
MAILPVFNRGGLSAPRTSFLHPESGAATRILAKIAPKTAYRHKSSETARKSSGPDQISHCIYWD